MHINGASVPARSGATFPTTDPSTGRHIADVPRGDSVDVDHAVQAAADAAIEWQFSDAITRAGLLRRLGALVSENADELARIESIDSGHYLGKARELVDAMPLWLEYWAGAADKVGGRTIAVPGNKISFTLLEPLGVTAHIIPWNYPLLILVRSVAPALALGNTCVVKPAEDTSLSALKFAELVQEAGFPDGVFNVVTGYGAEAGAALAAHPEVRGITFTGSTETGREIARLGGQHIAQVNLELGGKSPLVVFPDAPLEDAVEVAVQGFCSRAGQVCVAGSRLFLHEDIADQFLEMLVARLRTAVIGDPFDDNTQMGPLASQKHFDRVREYIEIGKQEATLLYGGGQPEHAASAGFFVEPTVFVDVPKDARIAREEIFGPVTAVMRWSSVEDLIATINDSDYGLFAVLWCQDITSALDTAKRLQVGSVMINDWFGELPMTPHGGHKQSGTGREEGLEAVHGYTQVKHIGINLDRSPAKASNWAGAPL
ncbi:aldehyde dehydrogenase family protein [Candidatus Mycolicibacterium alkanivorans]|uniref:Aldehyde dehydrogenase family protein n=1 Tax=Candidatus Mycolicibacterium alkanivorans TaxID=2954114 RepID=A0ABS9YYD8_9MYCO|nr:aldehyde dehydrogenase family protein [Candidatus Mycolicibacterium alkanivorans]MCI4675844.1 aldehyde dehydrogenase family protein [Candidatus Mycolicibacterium alkanivorans]